MPMWPADGSVDIIDDVIVVNFGLVDITFENGEYFKTRHWRIEKNEQQEYKYYWQIYKNGSLIKDIVTDIPKVYTDILNGNGNYEIRVRVKNVDSNFSYPISTMKLLSDDNGINIE